MVSQELSQRRFPRRLGKPIENNEITKNTFTLTTLVEDPKELSERQMDMFQELDFIATARTEFIALRSTGGAGTVK
jgi:hypothetical protein